MAVIYFLHDISDNVMMHLPWYWLWHGRCWCLPLMPLTTMGSSLRFQVYLPSSLSSLCSSPTWQNREHSLPFQNVIVISFDMQVPIHFPPLTFLFSYFHRQTSSILLMGNSALLPALSKRYRQGNKCALMNLNNQQDNAWSPNEVSQTSSKGVFTF